jgi:hypothetical protein
VKEFFPIEAYRPYNIKEWDEIQLIQENNRKGLRIWRLPYRKGIEMETARVYLAVDNCFASKRWTKPSEWMEVIKEAGLYYIEASADNECDPLYTTPDYIKDWIKEIKEYSDKTGVKVVNLYSGHGTYTTLGLAHTDKRIRDRMLNEWLKKMVKAAINLKAGMGFFAMHFLILYCKIQSPTL